MAGLSGGSTSRQRTWGSAPDGLPIAGYRAWRAVKDESGYWRLRSVTRDVMWPAENALRARCLPSDARSSGERHRAPDEGCRCGVYGLAVAERPSIQAALAAVRAADGVGLFLSGATVLGLVQGYGEVVISERGWRAEFARVEALFAPSLSFTFVTTRSVEAIAARYRVPIIY